MTDSHQIDGIRADAVTAWFGAHVSSARPPLTFELIAGGRSNLTYRVADADGGAWVLRRPPLGHVLATAHDMSREHRIISALASTDVPVAPAVALCEDADVNGAPFYVMDFVDGAVLRDLPAAQAVAREVRQAAGASLVDVLARIHAVDPDRVGLGDLGRREGYIARQLKRWHGQWEQSGFTDLTGIDTVHGRLAAAIPDQGPATIVHGDYRLDNCVLNADGTVRAVLDWELCTLGDPLADLGLLFVYWTDPDDTFTALPGAPTLADGFPTRAELLAGYEARSGRDVSDIAFYEAFGYWKLACILAGVATRYTAGAMGGDAEQLGELFSAQLGTLVNAADAATTRAGR